MRFIEAFSIGLSAIWANKTRSLLTILGIIIGVAAVLAMIAIGDGAKEIVLQDAQRLGGANQIILRRKAYKRLNNHWVRIRTKAYFKYGDVIAIEAECPSVSAVTPRIWSGFGILFQAQGGAEARASYNGIDASYQAAMKWEVKAGRFITDEDVENATKVCVLGAGIATALFGNESPLGQEIKIARQTSYTDPWGRHQGKRSTERSIVVGTMMPRGRNIRFGASFDNLAFIPFSTVQERFTGSDSIQEILVYAHTIEDVPKAIEEVKAVIRKRHKNRDDFFRVFEMRAGIAQLEKISQVIKITLGSIAGFSLLVGGIGIMNMMLVAVSERTRENGLRKAVGAKRLDILLQFLIEAIVICGIGASLASLRAYSLGKRWHSSLSRSSKLFQSGPRLSQGSGY